MSKRARFYSGMEHAVDDLRENYEGFADDFRLFFPDLVAYVNKNR